MQSSRKNPRAIVLGTGIAGLSLAEILSRNGWRITLVDSSVDIGGDASRCTQNWMHTGWLYAGLPSQSAMQGCATSLGLLGRTYGAVLPPDVLNVEAGANGVRYSPSAVGWFHPEPMHYAFAVSSYDLSMIQKRVWSSYLDRVLLHRLRRLGYPTDELRDVPSGLANLMRLWENADDGPSKYRVIPSTDARIETKRVLGWLLRLLGEQTTVLAGAQVELVPEGERTAVRIDGELHRPDLCVLAAGRSIPDLLRQVGAGPLAREFRSVVSPIVVLRRALDLPNFIRFTPNLPETINHVKYSVGGEDVSTIGSYDFHPVGEQPAIEPFVEKVCRRLGVATSEVVGSYYGTKTEFSGKLARRYNHALKAVNENTYFAIAGKFSQFPLLVHEFAANLGLRVDIANHERGLLEMEVSATAPERLTLAAQNNPKRDAA